MSSSHFQQNTDPDLLALRFQKRKCRSLRDSHEYDADIEPFDKTQIDELMLRELKKVFALPEWNIAER